MAGPKVITARLLSSCFLARGSSRALCGYGGVGKTQIGPEYAHRYMAEYDVIWWVSTGRA